MSRALAVAPAALLPLGLVLAAAGAGVPWHVYTIAGPGASGSYAYGLLAYTVDACFSGSCVRETVQYSSFGAVSPELKALVACAFVTWAGCALLAAAAVASCAVAAARGQQQGACGQQQGACCRSSCGSIAGAALGWAGCVLLLVGLAVGTANFATVFKGAPDKPKLAAGSPLVGAGLALAVVGSALLSAAACSRGGGGRAASPLNSSPPPPQLQQQLHVMVVASPYAAMAGGAYAPQPPLQQQAVCFDAGAGGGGTMMMMMPGLYAPGPQQAVYATGASPGVAAMLPLHTAATGGEKPVGC